MNISTRTTRFVFATSSRASAIALQLPNGVVIVGLYFDGVFLKIVEAGEA